MTERTIQVMLSSNDAIYVNPNENEYIFEIDQLLASQQNHIYMKVLDAVFPLSFYNVNQSNNTLVLLINSNQTYTITVPEGNYNGRTIANNLTQLINLNGLAVTFNDINSKISFSYSLPISILNSSTILNTLGFTDTTLGLYYTSTNSYILTSQQPINFQQVTHICIILPNIDTCGILLNRNNQDNLLSSIPINSPPMTNLVFINQEALEINTERNDLRQILIKITDQFGNIIDFNGLPFFINILFRIVNFVV